MIRRELRRRAENATEYPDDRIDGPAGIAISAAVLTGRSEVVDD
jgi:hypothetical protein